LEIVARQIDQICAHRLTNAEAAPAAPNGGSARVLPDFFHYSAP